jgi:hypothetical protein
MQDIYKIVLPGGRHIYDQLRAGDFILTQGQGWLFQIVSCFLSKVEPSWRRLPFKPLHMSFAIDSRGFLFEGYFPEARTRHISELPQGTYRVYRWFSEPLDPGRLAEFIKSREGARYDIDCYFWTFWFYMLKGWIRLPRIINNRFTCWEICADLALWFGDPWDDMYSYPLITNFLKAMRLLK